MRFANEYEIDCWLERWARDPILSCAAATLCSLKDAVNACSDGWAYWQAPARSAQKLIALLFDADDAYRRGQPQQLPVADLDRAYRPIKAFRSRSGAKYGFDVALRRRARRPRGADPVRLTTTAGEADRDHARRHPRPRRDHVRGLGYGHTFLSEDESESCLSCGATYRLIANDPAEPSHGRYCAANGDDPLPCTGDTRMAHEYPGERCDGNSDHQCNCIRCA